MPSAINIVRTWMSGSLAVQGQLRPCMARGRGSEQAQECGECGGLSGRCGVQDSAVRDRDLVVRGRDSPWLAKTWPRLSTKRSEGVGPLHHVEPIHLMELTRPYDGCALVYRTTAASLPTWVGYAARGPGYIREPTTRSNSCTASVGGWMQLRKVHPPPPVFTTKYGP